MQATGQSPVPELNVGPSEATMSQMDLIIVQMERHAGLLTSLREGSSDFTLHLAIVMEEGRALRIPEKLSRLAWQCGIEIEIMRSEDNPGFSGIPSTLN